MNNIIKIQFILQIKSISRNFSNITMTDLIFSLICRRSRVVYIDHETYNLGRATPWYAVQRVVGTNGVQLRHQRSVLVGRKTRNVRQ